MADKVNTNIKKGYIDKNSKYNADYINKDQAYQTDRTGSTFIEGKPVDTNYWATSGGGGKNTLYGNTGQKNYAGTGFTDKDFLTIKQWVDDHEKQLEAEKRQAETDAFNRDVIAPMQAAIYNMQTQQNDALQNAQKLSAQQINNNYNLSARDYYQLYKTQQAKLPENLSKAGVTGGASESAQLKLMNNYSENLYKNEAARNNQLAGVNQNYNDQIARNSINAANQMANAYLQMAQQQLAYKRQDELAAKEQQAQAEENAAAQTVAQWNANVRARMEEQLAKGDTIWTWTDESGRIHWTTYESRGLAMGGKKLSPSSSKVKSSGGSSTDPGDSNNNPPVAVETTTPTSATSYSYDTLKYNMTNALLKGATKAQLQTFVNPIEASYKSGKITEKQARELLKMLGA